MRLVASDANSTSKMSPTITPATDLVMDTVVILELVRPELRMASTSDTIGEGSGGLLVDIPSLPP